MKAIIAGKRYDTEATGTVSSGEVTNA